MGKMIKVRTVKLYELTVEISPGAFRTIPQGCVGEVPEDAEVVKRALKEGGIEKVDSSAVDGSRGMGDGEVVSTKDEGQSKSKSPKVRRKRARAKKK